MWSDSLKFLLIKLNNKKVSSLIFGKSEGKPLKINGGKSKIQRHFLSNNYFSA